MTERSESERAGLVALNEWMREPDYAENFSLADITDWINRRPIATAARLAAQDQKPVAWQCAGCGRLCGDPNADFDDLKSRGFLSCCPERKMEIVSPPPAAGWDEFKPTQEQINSACMTYRHDFGLLDQDMKNSLRAQAREWLHVWQKEYAYALRHNAPPDSGAGKSDDAGARISNLAADLVVSGWMASNAQDVERHKKEAEQKLLDFACDEVERHIKRDPSVMPDHGGADAGVMEEYWANKSDMDVAKFINLALLMCHGISEQDAGFDTITSINDVGLKKVAWIIGKVRSTLSKPAPVAANASAELQNDLAEMLRALGMSDAAQPKSPHEVFQSAIAEMKRQLANASAERDWSDPCDDPKCTAPACVANRKCFRCDGTGNVIDDPDAPPSAPCEACNGSGKTSANASAEARLREALEKAAGRFNLMGGVGLVNGVDPKVGCREAIEALSAHPHASDCDKQGER